MKKPLLIILGFILTIQVGAFLTEKVKQIVAHQLHYESDYRPGLGRSTFYNDEMGKAFDSTKQLYGNDSSMYRNSPEWKLLLRKDEKHYAMIELSGMLFVLLISAIGLGLFFYRKKNDGTMDMVSWMGIFMSLFFMREVLMNAFNWCVGWILCDENKLWTYFNLPYFVPVKFVTVMGMALFLFIFYSIPKGNKLLFLGCGFAGFVLGAFVWLHFLSRMLLM